MDVTKPTLPTTVTSVRASNRSGSSTQEHDHGLSNPAVRERDTREDRRSSGDRRQGERRRADDGPMLDTRSGEDRRKRPRRETDQPSCGEDDKPSSGIDVFV